MTTAVPGQSSSPPPNLLTPRLGAMPLATPLGALALDATPGGAGHPPSVVPAQQQHSETVHVAPMTNVPSADERGRHQADGRGDVDDSGDGHGHGSRSPSPALTVSNGPTSPPSATDSLAPSGSSMASPNPTTISTSSLPLSGAPASAPKAEVGFGSLHAEDEIKKALSSKDRLFVLMLGKEYEAFVGRVQRGEYAARVPPNPSSSTAAASSSSSLLEALGPSKKVDVTAVSKYQRMLTYKLAEWYGLRAAPGVDGPGSMVVGVHGVLDPRSSGLKIATVVPEATAPQTQQFRIMRREAPSGGDDDGVSRATSVSGDGEGAEGSGTRGKTLEERTLAYALARKRIIGDDDVRDDESVSVSASASASQPRSRQPSRYGGDEEDDLDIVPRRAYQPEYEFVYPSLYHPSHDGQAPPMPQGVSPGVHPQFAFQGMQPPYQQFMSPQAMGYDGRQGYAMAPYNNMAQFPGQMAMTGYGQPWQQGGVQQPGPVSSMMVPNQGWYPPELGMAPPPGPSMMPMIPQGMPYPPSFGYSQQPQHQQGGPSLVQPTPTRPGLDPLSSTASSISSRSYQDVHSRPHSRGSTTSTRSAASSVRLGAMYPTGQQPNYGLRQKAVKPSQGSFSSSIKPSFEGKRNGRQSPASTTSSRSSRRTSSIHIQQPLPGQHPLPQRPDWAANNVPYHPSPMPLHGTGDDPSASDFPPLLKGAAGTSAEPMQVEKVKMRPSNGTVWDGSTAPRIHQPGHPPTIAAMTLSHGGITPQQLQSPPGPPAVSILANPNKTFSAPELDALPHAPPVDDADPDFPRRVPSSRTPSLYDPSAPAPPSRPAKQSPQSPALTPSTPAPAVVAPALLPMPVAPPPGAAPDANSSLPSTPAAPATPNADVPEDVIEARLAALNVKGGGAPLQAPSYAKIVRRD